MRASNSILSIAALAALLAALPLSAQAQKAAEAAPAPAAAGDVYRREVFAYQRGGRPDPFQPLLSAADLGFRVEDMRLTSIVYSPNPRMAMAVFASQADTMRRYRLRVGQRLGAMTIVRIYPQRVDVRVDDYGSSRIETLQLKRAEEREAAAAAAAQQPGAPPAAAPAPAQEPQRPAPLRRGGARPPAPQQTQQQPQSQASAPVRAARAAGNTYASPPRN